MRLGIIEGFYGDDWGWSARADSLPFLQEHHFEFFIYAPKSDRHLRKLWRERHPDAVAQSLRNFAQQCSDAGIMPGVGLTPLELHEAPGTQGRDALRRRVVQLHELGVRVLAVLFDDMRGDVPNLARTQAELVHVAADAATFDQVIMCPTYYTDSSILDRLFGERPPQYLHELGSALDPAIEVFWTGPKVLSESYPRDHIDRVTAELGRKPFIWDNYPVNDGPRMSKHLHLRTPDRPRELFEGISAIAINPMNQSWLSRIPLLAMSRTLRDDAAIDAIEHLLPTELARALRNDADTFQDAGLGEIDDDARQQFVAKYEVFDHPAAREIVDWLQGRYTVSQDILTDA